MASDKSNGFRWANYLARLEQVVANKRHTYSIRLDWTGNQGSGTSSYGVYSRAHELTAPGKAAIAGSSDPTFRGDPARWNPEELLVAARAACHQLWCLHLCADAGVVAKTIATIPRG